MKTFRDLEKDHHRMAVELIDAPESGSGFLILDRQNTVAVLTTSGYLGHPADESGWYDLTLRSSNSRSILLHNALTTTSISSSMNERSFEEHIYPNLVILNAESLGKARQIKSVSFRLARLRTFFHYQHIERQWLYQAPPETVEKLKDLRRDRPQGYDFFSPSEVYVLHRVPRAMRFKIQDRTYEIHMGLSSQGLGWNQLRLSSEPIATITFESPVSIDQAIDKVWDWKRFFTVFGMNPMPVTSLSAKGRVGPRERDADFYLPAYEDEPDNEGLHRLHPATVPLNRWKDRKRLQAIMRNWLERSSERQVFRALLAGVIEDLPKRISLDDVVKLCAGVETLDELDEASPISGAHLERLSAATSKAIDEHTIPVTKQRVDSVLAMLRNQSLPQRLRLIFDRLGPVVSDEDATLLRKAVVELRNIAAHGKNYTDQMMPRIEPTVTALASVCAMYDLFLAGFLPSEGRHLGRASNALAHLRHLSKAASKPA